MKSTWILVCVSALLLSFTSCKKEVADCSASTGTLPVSTDPTIESMRQAMRSFRTSLPENLLAQCTACLEDSRVTRWHNTPPSITPRDGIRYADLNDIQLDLFRELLQQFLSADGYRKVDQITTLAEGFLDQIEDDIDWGTEHYTIALFGDPEISGSWGFQLDGHHCAVNFLVHGEQVSMVPAFLAAEPVVGNFNGQAFDIFRDERDLALTLHDGLTPTERSAAVSTGSSNAMQLLPGEDGSEDPHAGNYDYRPFANGLRYTDMSAVTRAQLLFLMQEYVYNLNTTFADRWWNDVMNNIDDTYFVWISNDANPTTTSQFYYRIYNPYLWVEYSMEDPVGPGLESWNHAHTITRIPNNPGTANGGDYGFFAQVINQGGPRTLYEHYREADHHRNSKLLLDYVVKMPHQHHGHHHHPHPQG